MGTSGISSPLSFMVCFKQVLAFISSAVAFATRMFIELVFKSYIETCIFRNRSLKANYLTQPVLALNLLKLMLVLPTRFTSDINISTTNPISSNVPPYLLWDVILSIWKSSSRNVTGFQIIVQRNVGLFIIIICSYMSHCIFKNCLYNLYRVQRYGKDVWIRQFLYSQPVYV